MATHSNVLAWRIPGMGEPGGLPSMGSIESDTTEATQQQQHYINVEQLYAKILAVIHLIFLLINVFDILKNEYLSLLEKRGHHKIRQKGISTVLQFINLLVIRTNPIEHLACTGYCTRSWGFCHKPDKVFSRISGKSMALTVVLFWTSSLLDDQW